MPFLEIQILSLAVSLVLVVLWFSPGFLLANIFCRGIKSQHFLLYAFIFSSLISYIGFYLFLITPVAGMFYSASLIIVSIIYFVIVKELRQAVFASDSILQLSLLYGAGLLYLGICFVFKLNFDAITYVSHRLFDFGLPPDNLIPFLVTEQIYQGELSEYVIGDWRVSDRPPLLSSMILFLRPYFIGVDPKLCYQIIGSLFSASWILGIWSLVSCIAKDKKLALRVISLLLLTGICFLHTSYLSPKMLTVPLTIPALILLIEKETPNKIRIFIMSAASIALAMLAHGGIFSFVFVLICGALVKFRFSKATIYSASTVVVLYLPWIIFQKFINPPGDRLLRWHFFGDRALDSKSLLVSFKEAYIHPELSQILYNKLMNFRALFFYEPSPLSDILSNFSYKEPANLAAWIRFEQFFSLVPAAGILFLGFLIQIFYLSRPSNLDLEKLKKLYLILCFTLAVWVFAQYGPPYSTAVVHHGPFANHLLLIALGAIFFANMKSLQFYICFALSLVLFAWVWVISNTAHLSSTYHVNGIGVFMLMVSAISLSIAYFRRPV